MLHYSDTIPCSNGDKSESAISPAPIPIPAGPSISPSFLVPRPSAPNDCPPAPNGLPPATGACSTSRTIDQMIEDTIFKVTAHSNPYPPSPDPSLIFHNHSNHSQAFDFVPQPYGLPQWPSQPPQTQPIRPFPELPTGPPFQPSSSQPQQQLAFSSAGSSQSTLPADILHILESDFTSGAPDRPDQKAAEIRRVAEELRVKVRLSRYRRARDELSESGEEDGTTVGGSNSASEDEVLEEGEFKTEELDEVDGSGDEEGAISTSNQALLKLKMEIEQIIGIPEDLAQPITRLESISATEARTEAQEKELVMESINLVSLAPPSQEPESDSSSQVDTKVKSTEVAITPAEPESPLVVTKTPAQSIPLCSQPSQEPIIQDGLQIGSTTEAGLGLNQEEVIKNSGSPTINPEEPTRHLPRSPLLQLMDTTTPADSSSYPKAIQQTETITGDLSGPSFDNEPEDNVGDVAVDRLVEQSKDPVGESSGASPIQQPAQKTSESLPVRPLSEQPEKLVDGNGPIASSDGLHPPGLNLPQVSRLVDVDSTQAEDDRPEPVQSRNQRRRRKRATKKRNKVEESETPSEDDSSVDDDDPGSTCGGPTTANELKEPPPDATEVPFEKLSEHELESIIQFGTVMAVITSVLVIKGTAGLGYDKVLDEGSLVCFADGLVIGKVFETFGSVTDPHYSIRLPAHLDSSAAHVSPTAGMPVYFVPSHSSFVFTSVLKAQPKGTDASNLYDEELGVDEIEFSDDEAEAAYVRSCRQAKKAAAAARRATGASGAHGRGAPPKKEPILVSEDGRQMLTKRLVGELNYDNEDDDGLGSTDYSLLERPKGGLDSGEAGASASASASHHEPSGLASTDKRGQSRRGRGARGASRGRDGRDRSRRKGPARDPSGTPGKPGQEGYTVAFGRSEPLAQGTISIGGGPPGFGAPGPAFGLGGISSGSGMGGVSVASGSGYVLPFGGPLMFNGMTGGGGGYQSGVVGYNGSMNNSGVVNFCYRQPGMGDRGSTTQQQQISNYHHHHHQQQQQQRVGIPLGFSGGFGFGFQVPPQQQRGSSSSSGGGGGGVFNPRFFGL